MSDDVKCIRRAGSEWTLCKCGPCREEMRRKVKLHRNGIPVAQDLRQAARERLDQWADAGYSVGVIAAMTGIRKATLSRHVNGQRQAISHSTVVKTFGSIMIYKVKDG